MLTRLDAWLGLNLFHPPIIRFCQVTGYTQYQFSRDLWFVGILGQIYDSVSKGGPVWLIVIQSFLGFVLGLKALALPKDTVETSFPWMRAFLLSFTPIAIFFIVDAEWVMAVAWLGILFAEYALTIGKLPPREEKEVKGTAHANIGD